MAKGGHKPKYLDQACPNLVCSLYGQKGKGKRVSKGTYLTKSGRGRRVVCRRCKTNFRPHTGPFLYALRPPKEQGLLALKLLGKERSLRRVAEGLAVQFDTIRSWLRLAAAHSASLHEMLRKALQVSQVEREARWSWGKNA